MSIILYQATDVGDELERIIRIIGLGDELEVYQSLGALRSRLRSELHSVSSVVLRITTREELDEIFEYRHILDGLRVIVAPKGSDRETLNRVHALFPRYVSLQSCEFHDIGQVLGKMYKRAAENRSEQKE